MSNTFTTTRARGFTLIELLVVIAIIGLLSTIIAAPIQNARKKARDSKKIAEIKAIQLAVEQYAESNLGNYPRTLDLLAPNYMPILPASGYASTTATKGTNVSPRDKYAYAPYLASGPSVQTGGVIFGYHLGAHLESYAQALESDRDCVAATNDSDFKAITATSTSCAFWPASDAVVFGSYASSTNDAFNNRITGMIPVLTGTQVGAGATGWATVGSDFSGADNGTTTCNALTDCVFDITGQN